MLLVASYVFYGAWDWRFLSLLFISSLLDYFFGLRIAQTPRPRKKRRYLFLSIFISLSVLGFFKYFNFFAQSLRVFLSHFHITLSVASLNIVLPVGISFYTFQTMSYIIDIYYGRLKPARNFLDFALYVSFFPQLVAGPIERSRHLLPQITSPRVVTLDGFYQGCFLIFWGLFQKVFIADNMVSFVDPVFNGEVTATFTNVLGALYAFAFQIYCDFAGYSNMARGIGRCLGFDIMMNFNVPYLSLNPREFWRRWHISLSTWLRDYLYIPLGGNKKGAWTTLRNLMVTMLLGGLWHGAAWTFFLWGGYHGALLVIQRVWESVRPPSTLGNKQGKHWFGMTVKTVVFFHLVCYGWLMFRAVSVGQIGEFTNILLFGWREISWPDLFSVMANLSFYLWILILVDMTRYFKGDVVAVYRMNAPVKTVFYAVCFILLIIFGESSAKPFIYFQF
jgi:D-alanyl-lipoteichoic acid acyltransferase DltB (MBOAT superfamily)